MHACCHAGTVRLRHACAPPDGIAARPPEAQTCTALAITAMGQLDCRRPTGEAVCPLSCASCPFLWQGCDPREGLPKIRQEWVARREARGDKVHTQASCSARDQLGVPCIADRHCGAWLGVQQAGPRRVAHPGPVCRCPAWRGSPALRMRQPYTLLHLYPPRRRPADVLCAPGRHHRRDGLCRGPRGAGPRVRPLRGGRPLWWQHARRLCPKWLSRWNACCAGDRGRQLRGGNLRAAAACPLQRPA